MIKQATIFNNVDFDKNHLLFLTVFNITCRQFMHLDLDEESRGY